MRCRCGTNCQDTGHGDCRYAKIVVMPDVRSAAEAENEARDALPKLWNAIIAHTRDDSMFWIGEILLSEITKETGYAGPVKNGDRT